MRTFEPNAQVNILTALFHTEKMVEKHKETEGFKVNHSAAFTEICFEICTCDLP